MEFFGKLSDFRLVYFVVQYSEWFRNIRGAWIGVHWTSV